MTPTRIDWTAEHCRLLRSISTEFRDTLPFRGLTIGTGIHLEAKTVALLLTLRDGGARLVSTDSCTMHGYGVFVCYELPRRWNPSFSSFIALTSTLNAA
ncbi:MAG: hypothetical protein ACRDPD_28460 [Streptosporangiaceae bacterium]